MQQSFLLVPTEEFNKIQQQLSELKLLVLQKQNSEHSILGDWITQYETMKLLGIKETSLYKLRKDGFLIATKTRPIFYSMKSIEDYLKRKS